MAYLLDTHIFIWAATEPEKLSANAKTALADLRQKRYLSAASVWEMAVKHNIGKMNFRLPLDEFVRENCRQLGVSVLPILLPHILGVLTLPMHHRDPFDRLILSQGKITGYTLISADGEWPAYGLPIIR